MEVLLLSPISKLCRTRTPWMHDSRTCAPCDPKEFPLRSKWISAVDSLHARPKRRFLRASSGSLQLEMFRCLRLRELVKNCLKDGGISLPFLVLNELCATFRWIKCVEQPRRSAPNNCRHQTHMLLVRRICYTWYWCLRFQEVCPSWIYLSAPGC